MNRSFLTPAFLAPYVGGTLDFTLLGAEAAGGISHVEVSTGASPILKVTFGWVAIIQSGRWMLAPHPPAHLSTEISFIKQVEEMGQNRRSIKFALGDVVWKWLFKPPHKGKPVTFEMHAGLQGTSG